MKEVKELERRIASLETQVDFFETQIERLDRRLKDFGFDDGVATLCETIDEAIETEKILRRNW